MDEFQRIETFLRSLAGPEGLELKDDAAWLQPPPNHTLIATKDALVAGVHFLGTEDPAFIARKALRVNLSDLAAMGALPYGYLLATQLPRGLPEDWLARYAQGLAQDQAEFGLHLFGGDSVATPGPIALSVTMLGLLKEGEAPLRRNGARLGDAVCISGTLGQGALGLAHAKAGLDSPLAERYFLPQPRMALGRALQGIAHAAMDISDGLLQDAGHLAAASGLGMEIDASALPVDASGAFDAKTCLRAALAGGDDYELLFTLPPAAWDVLIAQEAAKGLRLTRIGRMVAGQGVQVQNAPFAMEASGGWKHF